LIFEIAYVLHYVLQCVRCNAWSTSEDFGGLQRWFLYCST